MNIPCVPAVCPCGEGSFSRICRKRLDCHCECPRLWLLCRGVRNQKLVPDWSTIRQALLEADLVGVLYLCQLCLPLFYWDGPQLERGWQENINLVTVRPYKHRLPHVAGAQPAVRRTRLTAAPSAAQRGEAKTTGALKRNPEAGDLHARIAGLAHGLNICTSSSNPGRPDDNT